jgi:hypothetical protein
MSENVVPVWPVPSRDDLEPILRGYQSIILEAEEWRPLAQYVNDLCRACVRGAEERLEAQVAVMREALEWARNEARGRLPDWWLASFSTVAASTYQSEHEALKVLEAAVVACYGRRPVEGHWYAPQVIADALAGVDEARRVGASGDAENKRERDDG